MEDFLFIRTGKRYLQIKLSDILCIEGYENYTKVHTTTKMHLITATMKEIEKHLPLKQFCRVHKSWVVNLAQIISFDDIIVELKQLNVPVGRTYKNALFEKVIVMNEMRKGDA